MAERPEFRFYPDAYANASNFEASERPCSICEEPSGYRYIGSIYATEKPEVVCARCLSVGRLVEVCGRYVQTNDIDYSDEPDSHLWQEVLSRTPGVCSFNPFIWPVIHGKPLAFVGCGDDQRFMNIPEARLAMREAAEEMGWPADEPSGYFLMFKEIDGPRYRVAIASGFTPPSAS